MSELKCFRVDAGGEHFHYAAKTAERAITEYRETWGSSVDADESEPTVREVDAGEMEKRTVQMEDEDGFPDGNATLKAVFEDACKTPFVGAIEIFSSVY